MEGISYFYVLLAGLLSFLSPCVLPIVPGYLCFIAGTSLDKALDNQEALRSNILKYAISFVLGFSVVFVLMGASATYLSSLLYEYFDYLRIIGGIIIIIFGIHFTQLIQLPFLNSDTRIQINNYKPGLIGSFVVGLSFAFGWTPCIGPILGSVLSVAASSENVSEGTFLLVLYSAGLGIPFIVAAYGIGAFLKFLSKIRKHIRTIEIFTGLLLIIFGVLILTNRIQELAFFFIKYFPFLTQIG
jgi:cytochrome c-type biogenesis protein|tara:strand:+ start:195 stop:923 length:729 start_codon:yes stop_codon:yes gene_type:complete